jgi:multiple sugar transport system ATP-binding protein
VPGLQLRGVSKSFKGTHVLDAVDLDIAQREFIAFLGPSGSGKTTLLRIIAGLETADSGEVILEDRRIDTLGRATATSPWCSSPTRFTRT